MNKIIIAALLILSASSALVKEKLIRSLGREYIMSLPLIALGV